jgi:hypothetical protein
MIGILGHGMDHCWSNPGLVINVWGLGRLIGIAKKPAQE